MTTNKVLSSLLLNKSTCADIEITLGINAVTACAIGGDARRECFTAPLCPALTLPFDAVACYRVLHTLMPFLRKQSRIPHCRLIVPHLFVTALLLQTPVDCAVGHLPFSALVCLRHAGLAITERGHFALIPLWSSQQSASAQQVHLVLACEPRSLLYLTRLLREIGRSFVRCRRSIMADKQVMCEQLPYYGLDGNGGPIHTSMGVEHKISDLLHPEWLAAQQHNLYTQPFTRIKMQCYYRWMFEWAIALPVLFWLHTRVT